MMGALAAAGITTAALAAGAFSLAGADWPEDFVLFEGELRRMGLRRFTVVNDALGALWAGAPAGAAVSVVCGTGVAVGARGHDGQLWHGSFWLEPLGARGRPSAPVGVAATSSGTSRSTM